MTISRRQLLIELYGIETQALIELRVSFYVF